MRAFVSRNGLVRFRVSENVLFKQEARLRHKHAQVRFLFLKNHKSVSSAVFRNLSGIGTRIGIVVRFTIPNSTTRQKQSQFRIPDFDEWTQL